MILSASTHRVRPVRAALRHLHTELVFQIREIMKQPDAAFVRGFPSMVAAVEAGLRHEELLLELLGDRHLRERRAENAMILCSLHRVASRVERGDAETGRQIAAALAVVLSLHRLSAVLARAGMPRPLRLRCRFAAERKDAIPARLRQPRRRR